MRLSSACSCSCLFILYSSSAHTVWCASQARSLTLSLSPQPQHTGANAYLYRIQTVVGCRVLRAVSSNTLVPLSFLSYWPFSPSSSSTFFFSCFTSWSRSCTQNKDTTAQPVTSKCLLIISSKLQTVMRVICNLLQDKKNKQTEKDLNHSLHRQYM